LGLEFRHMILDDLSSIDIVGLTIIGEARGEPIEGQVAVGCVIRNRLHSNPAKYNGYHSVCLERKQFSCWNIDDKNRPVLIELAEKLITGRALVDPYFRQCMWVSCGIVSWDIRDNTKGALNYMTTNLFESDGRPGWARNPRNASNFGKQIFFNV